VCGFDIRFYQF
jgi:dipeptidyl-peptidase III